MRVNKLKSRYLNLHALVSDLFVIVNNEPVHTITLASNTSTTSVANALAGSDSVIAFMPVSADAASEPIWVSTQDKGYFRLAHSSGASTRIFKYMVHG